MAQIDNFEKFVQIYENEDYEDEPMELTAKEVEGIKNSILAFGDEPMKNADAVLADYYSMKVPHSIIKDVLSKNFELAYEVHTDGVRDTCQREIFVDAILSYIGVRSWPIFAEGEQSMREFVLTLKSKADEFGIEFITDIQ